MTKADIVSKISDKSGIEKADVLATVEAFMTEVKSALEQGDNVYLRGFGLQSTDYTIHEDEYREIVMQTVTELDIPIIDIQNEVFKTHPDPLSLFPFRGNYHYNAKGYRLVAEAIRKQLDSDHYIKIN